VADREAFLEEWCRGASPHRLARYGGVATWRALAFFGIAAMPVLLWVQVETLLLNNPDPFQGLMDVPFLLLLLLAPWIAGGVTGVTTPVGPVPAAARLHAHLSGRAWLRAGKALR
jgi:hypothetical protein